MVGGLRIPVQSQVIDLDLYSHLHSLLHSLLHTLMHSHTDSSLLPLSSLVHPTTRGLLTTANRPCFAVCERACGQGELTAPSAVVDLDPYIN
jgi:hypothetical protein